MFYIYTLLDGKLYRCPFIANAAVLNAIPDNPANYILLARGVACAGRALNPLSMMPERGRSTLKPRSDYRLCRT